MFVTSSDDHCIYVYDKSGNKKVVSYSSTTLVVLILMVTLFMWPSMMETGFTC